MKIVFYIASLYGGGAERVLVNLMNYLSERGETVELILNSKSGPYLSLLNESVTVYELDTKYIKHSIFELAEYLKRNKPDYALSTLHDCNYALILAGKLSRANTRILVREANSFITKTQRLPLSRKLYERWKARLFYPLADEIFVNSKGSRDELKKLTWRKDIKILPNPLDLKNISDKAKEKLPKDIADFLEGNPYIVAAGRLVEAKGFDILIKAFYKLSNKEAKLIILGEGDKREELQNLINNLDIKDRVLMPGYVGNPYSVMGRADLFVLSSRNEGMPNVLLEAMALGLPLVTTDCPSGPRELLRDGKFGRLVPMEDVKKLSKAIDQQFGADVMNKKERNDYVKQFDIECVGIKFYSMLQKSDILDS